MRQPEIEERQVVMQWIVRALQTGNRKALGPNGYRMKDCVRFVIESPLFMEK